MDSTLIDAETIDELARAAGVVSKVEEITKRAMYGDLDFEQALIERVRLLKGLPLETALDAVDKINLMPGAAELILYVKSRGYKTAMISGGFTISADVIGKVLGVDFIVSNELLVEDGCLTGKVVGPITQSDSKAKVFEELTRLNGVRPEQCVVVGDAFNLERILRYETAKLSGELLHFLMPQAYRYHAFDGQLIGHPSIESKNFLVPDMPKSKAAIQLRLSSVDRRAHADPYLP